MRIRTAIKIYKRIQHCAFLNMECPYSGNQILKALRATSRHSPLEKAWRRAGHHTPLDSQNWPKYRKSAKS